MRLALLKRLPALSADYGLMPWDLERLTEGELVAYLEHQNAGWDAIKRRNAELARKRRR